jgi:hypothetical protein
LPPDSLDDTYFRLLPSGQSTVTVEEAAMLAAVFGEDGELPARPAATAQWRQDFGLAIGIDLLVSAFREPMNIVHALSPLYARSVESNRKGRHAQGHADPITLTVIGVLACTVLPC